MAEEMQAETQERKTRRCSGRGWASKGIFFTIDAILAVSLIFIAIILISGFHNFSPRTVRIDYTSYDILQVLGEMRVHESSSAYVQDLVANGTITRTNNTILEQIGEFWADNETVHARNMVVEVMRNVYGNDTHWALAIAGEVVYNTSDSSASDNVRSAKRMVSGLEKLKPTYGFTARALLTQIRERINNGLGYFGGFIGQGNMSIELRLTQNISKVSEIYLEVAAGNNFTLFINGNRSGFFEVGSGGGNLDALRPDSWSLAPGNFSLIRNGTNIIEVFFDHPTLDRNYFAGGYMRVKYNTISTEEPDVEFLGPSLARKVYRFPGIYGAINLFDSFYVPGTILNMSASLHYFTNHSKHNNTIIFSIADYPLLVDNFTNVTQNATFNDSYLRSIFVDYAQFNDTSVPIRFGFANISGSLGLVDVAMVTDRSGSMLNAGWTLLNDSTPNNTLSNVLVPNGGWSSVYTFEVSSTGALVNGIVFEAESYTARINRSSKYWESYTAWAGYSGASYMRSMPNTGVTISSNYAATSPEMTYTINIPSAGTYYVWVRGYASSSNDDTVNVGLNGMEIASSDKIRVTNLNQWQWTKSTLDGVDATINVPSAGVHTFNVWMREDGFAIDKILLTKSSSYVPSGANPSLPVTQKALAVSTEWDRRFGYNGSEGSELLVNVRRPSGTWIIGGGNSLPSNPSASGVDPPTLNVGTAVEYFSGRSTKPQAILIEDPVPGTYSVAVYGMLFRPSTGPPPYLNTTVNIFIDTYADPLDNVNKSDTVISFDAAKQAARLFTNLTSSVDQLALISFSSTASTNQVLTFNKNLMHSAINAMSASGGTRIDLGIEAGARELNSTRARANASQVMILMTDGQNDVSPNLVIAAAQQAKSQGIRIFTISLSSAADLWVMEQVASSPADAYFAPTGADLEEIYTEISRTINAQYHSQILFLTGTYQESVLFPDSYVEFLYEPVLQPLAFGEIPLTGSGPYFNESGNVINFSADVKVTDIKAMSFSAQNWTSLVSIAQGNVSSDAFHLGRYGLNYSLLGDPFLVHIPVNYYVPGIPNMVDVRLSAGSAQNLTNGSLYNRLIYSVRINTNLDLAQVVATNEGCRWYVEYEDNTQQVFDIPNPYLGNKTCYVANASYNPDDAKDIAVYSLFRKLDFNKNGKLEVKPDQSNLIIDISEVSSVPSLWGPSLFEVRSWN